MGSVMNVNGIQSTSNPYAGNSADRNAMGQQEFLQLLVAQMKNQDPINPMDGTEFASQLAQFNSVEQLIGVNSALTDLQQSQNIMSAGLTNSMAASLTGKEVKALSNEFNLQENSALDFSFKIPKSATEVEIVIKDENGNQVFTETMKGVQKGEHDYSWDGSNANGDKMPNGKYTVEVRPMSGDSPISVLTYTKGMAERVKFTGSGVYLIVNGLEVAIGNVEEIGVKND